jgi:hypothetical protein
MNVLLPTSEFSNTDWAAGLTGAVLSRVECRRSTMGCRTNRRITVHRPWGVQRPLAAPIPNEEVTKGQGMSRCRLLGCYLVHCYVGDFLVGAPCREEKNFR